MKKIIIKEEAIRRGHWGEKRKDFEYENID